MSTPDGFLEGKLLIAMPSMPDPRFARSVIMMCAHSESGAMGLIINRTAPDLSLGELFDQLSLDDEEEAEDETGEDVGSQSSGSALGASDQPSYTQPAVDPSQSDLLAQQVHLGGPVETKRGFVLHSRDYFNADASIEIVDGICLTATVDILKSMARGVGPRKSLLALGYAGWTSGQIEREIQSNSWLHVDANAEIVFETSVGDRYDEALGLLGVDPSFLVGSAGHA